MTAGQPKLSRRGFTFGVGALAGGLVIGTASNTVGAQTLSGEVTAWVVIEPDDTTIIRVARSDMGQGIFTALPMLVAEELECDWSRVRPEYVLAAENLARDRIWGDMVTSTSISVRASQGYLRKAGAQARMMLIAEAASRWNVPIEECAARDGVVTHARSGRTVRYGEIAAAASQRQVPEEVPLKRPEEWRLIGKPVRRVDTADKVTGKPIFASDVRLPGMLHAAVKNCPAYGGRLKTFDAGQVLTMQGVRHVVPVGETAVAVIAEKWWQAKKALDLLTIEWDETAGEGLSTDNLRQTFRQGLDADNAAIGHRVGDVDRVLASAAKSIVAEYEVPYLAHVTMEPQTCTVHVTSEGAEVWAPTQNGEGTLAVVAETLGLDRSNVVVHKCHLGGGFGRRGRSQDWARQAALIAKVVDQPVKMIWSREEDFARDFYRPMIVARQTAGFDSEGRLIGWKIRLCGSSIAAGLAPQWLKDGHDMAMLDGFTQGDLLYSVPAFEAGCVMRNTHIPVGFWRGVNLSQNGYFREAFIDEMAQASGKDPYEFRRDLLASSPRALAVLDEAARRVNWGHPPDGVHQGIALVEGDNSLCAEVVELSLDAGGIKLHRIICVIDPVYPVNPDMITAQMEGGITQGLSAALTGEITFSNGQVDQSNFHDYPFLRINEMPAVETYLLPSGDKYSERWGGVGETGLPPLAPALVNALYAASGKPIRSLPLKSHGLGLA